MNEVLFGKITLGIVSLILSWAVYAIWDTPSFNITSFKVAKVGLISVAVFSIGICIWGILS